MARWTLNWLNWTLEGHHVNLKETDCIQPLKMTLETAGNCKNSEQREQHHLFASCVITWLNILYSNPLKFIIFGALHIWMDGKLINHRFPILSFQINTTYIIISLLYNAKIQFLLSSLHSSKARSWWAPYSKCQWDSLV